MITGNRDALKTLYADFKVDNLPGLKTNVSYLQKVGPWMIKMLVPSFLTIQMLEESRR